MWSLTITTGHDKAIKGLVALSSFVLFQDLLTTKWTNIMSCAVQAQFYFIFQVLFLLYPIK
jgi:hypothetical protein